MILQSLPVGFPGCTTPHPKPSLAAVTACLLFASTRLATNADFSNTKTKLRLFSILIIYLGRYVEPRSPLSLLFSYSLIAHCVPSTKDRSSLRATLMPLFSSSCTKCLNQIPSAWFMGQAFDVLKNEWMNEWMRHLGSVERRRLFHTEGGVKQEGNDLLDTGTEGEVWRSSQQES